MILLIADDQSSVHKLICHSLKQEELGITKVLHAENGIQALQIVEQEHPDILLLDIEMPGLSGLDVAGQLSEMDNISVIILSAFSTFEYAQKALRNSVKDYLLKPIDMSEVNRVLKDNIAQIRQQTYLELIGKIQSSYMLDELSSHQIEELQKLAAKSHLQYFGMVGARQGAEISSPSPIQHAFSTSFSWAELHFYTFDKQEDWDALFSACWQSTAHIGFSRAFTDIEQLLLCYKEVKMALSQDYYDTGTMFYIENFYSKNVKDQYTRQLREIILSFKQNREKDLTHNTDKLFSMFQNNRLHPKYVYELCRSIIEKCKGESLYEEDFAVQTDSSSWGDTAIQTKAIFMQTLRSLLDLEFSDGKSDIQIIMEIKDYIDHHFDCDLSMDFISTRFFINKFQISRLFKKKFGVNYHDYVIKVRMEQAAKLIEKTDKKLYEISQAVGYNDPSYFSIAYKKYYGVNPNRLRAKNRDDG